MEHENSNRNDSVFSRKIRAGRRRTYFFDVRTTKGNDYYITITESKKRFDGNGYDRHKLFIYKEDFNKFADELQQVIDHIKGLLPDFDFDAFAHRYDENGEHYDGGNHQHHDDDREQYNDNSNSSSSDNTSTDNNSGHHYGDEDLKL
ncbi:MAG TPA: DUF3276 family protein [Chitinophagales bacterium]|nr:PUR family DNA/RNA-binding protein [Chitinophagales bacterium]HMX05264.1 DUF3276 family protein [Chitinophagales bacterium]HMZ89301.1 DUF3276 family protein [Chitinophagales bacterium]HNE45905.1 DUF3276 family protein [Chitinophagales bacterium]HNF70271.1 DUF3276 family protein [Chitinophagales bacterium]